MLREAAIFFNGRAIKASTPPPFPSLMSRPLKKYIFRLPEGRKGEEGGILPERRKEIMMSGLKSKKKLWWTRKTYLQNIYQIKPGTGKNNVKNVNSFQDSS